MSFFHFVKNIFRHPIQFTDTCLIKKEAQPPFRKYAWGLYITLGCVVYPLLSSIKYLIYASSRQQYLLIVASLVLLVLLLLYPVYRMAVWLFRKAVAFSGGNLSSDQAADIVLYQLVATLLPMLCLELVREFLISYVLPIIGQELLPISMLFSIPLFLLILVPRLLGISYAFFLQYKITAKTTNADPIKVYIWLMSLSGFIILGGTMVIFTALSLSLFDIKGVISKCSPQQIGKILLATALK